MIGMAVLAEYYEVLVLEHPGFGVPDRPHWLDNIHHVAYSDLECLRCGPRPTPIAASVRAGSMVPLRIAWYIKRYR